MEATGRHPHRLNSRRDAASSAHELASRPPPFQAISRGSVTVAIFTSKRSAREALESDREERLEVPREYFRWALFEVALPLMFPAVAFLLLCLQFTTMPQSTRGVVDAFSAVAGNGELLIFGALYLTGAAGTLLFDAEGRTQEGGDAVVKEANLVLVFSLPPLLFYMGLLVVCHIPQTTDAMLQLWVGVGSAVILLACLFVTHWVVARMHIRRLHALVQTRAVSLQYYR